MVVVVHSVLKRLLDRECGRVEISMSDLRFRDEGNAFEIGQRCDWMIGVHVEGSIVREYIDNSLVPREPIEVLTLAPSRSSRWRAEDGSDKEILGEAGSGATWCQNRPR